MSLRLSPQANPVDAARVIDAAAGNAGTLDAWSLIFYLGEHQEDS